MSSSSSRTKPHMYTPRLELRAPVRTSPAGGTPRRTTTPSQRTYGHATHTATTPRRSLTPRSIVTPRRTTAPVTPRKCTPARLHRMSPPIGEGNGTGTPTRYPLVSPGYYRSSAVVGLSTDRTPRLHHASSGQFERSTRLSQSPRCGARNSALSYRRTAASKDGADSCSLHSNGISHSTTESITSRYRAAAKEGRDKSPIVGAAHRSKSATSTPAAASGVAVATAAASATASMSATTAADGVERAKTPTAGSPAATTGSPTSSSPSSLHQSRALLRQFVQRWYSPQQENQGAYREGGYMTVEPGTVLQHRYVIVHKLGWGEFSTVWLAFDKKARDARRSFVAIKIAKCRESVVEASRYEVSLLHYLRKVLHDSVPVVPLLDAFEQPAEYGLHLCMVFPIHGPNLLCVIDLMKANRNRRREREMNMIKDITIGTLCGVAAMEAQNVLHTDLKPENILCASPDPRVMQLMDAFLARNADVIGTAGVNAAASAHRVEDGRHVVCIADFGLSVLLEPMDGNTTASASVGPKKGFRVTRHGVVDNMNGTLIQTREYRAPEILLGIDFNTRTDIWSIGCIVYELITGDFLFDPKRRARGEMEIDIEHLAMMMQVLGPVPHRIAALNSAPRVSGQHRPRYLHRYFANDGTFLYAERYVRYPRRSVAAELEKILDPAEAERAAQFIMSCFTYDPSERCCAADLLNHSWLRS